MGREWIGESVAWGECGLGRVWIGESVDWGMCGLGRVWTGKSVDWIDLAQVRDKWLLFFNTVMKLRVS